MNKHRPAIGANEPGDCRAPSVRPQAISALSVSHLVSITAPIELWSTFAKAEHWPTCDIERYRSRLFVDDQSLSQSLSFRNCDCQRVRRDCHRQIPKRHSLLACQVAESDGRRLPCLLNQGPIVWDRCAFPVFKSNNAETNRVLTELSDTNLNRTASDSYF